MTLIEDMNVKVIVSFSERAKRPRNCRVIVVNRNAIAHVVHRCDGMHKAREIGCVVSRVLSLAIGFQVPIEEVNGYLVPVKQKKPKPKQLTLSEKMTLHSKRLKDLGRPEHMGE